jgi:hypothetical protein
VAHRASATLGASPQGDEQDLAAPLPHHLCATRFARRVCGSRRYGPCARVASYRITLTPGSSMTSNQVAELLTFLGIKRSHSRPHVSNDNPYSEVQFKTLTYCPAFPERFGSIADARVFCESFFA